MKKLLIIGLLLTATNIQAGIFSKKKPGRTCIVCKQQMAWTDGHMVEFMNHLDEYGKHKRNHQFGLLKKINTALV